MCQRTFNFSFSIPRDPGEITKFPLKRFFNYFWAAVSFLRATIASVDRYRDYGEHLLIA